MSPVALSRVRVLDLSRVLAGPWASQMLADMGADVIKVERPGKGDDSRMFGPTFLKDKDGRSTRESAMYVSANRNKRSVTVNIAQARGQEIIRALAAKSDVLLENYKVGDLARYGLDFESIKAVNPRIIYCSVTGFGQSGPYSHRLGYDTVFQGMGGLMSVTGEPDDVPGGGPMKVGPSIVDVITGLYTSNAILSALYHRDAEGGTGQFIDVALLDSVIAALSHYTADYLISGNPPVRRGTEGNGGMPSQMFRCADGAIVMIAGNDEQYRRFCAALKHPELATDARFLTNADRVKNRKEMTPLLSNIIAGWKQRELLDTLEKAGVAAGPINNLREVFEDPQVRHRGVQVEVPHPLSGTVKLAANPIRYSATPIEQYTAPPLLGEHTDEVLSDILGMDAGTLDALRKDGII
jgi:crotonobetainyl-CoA:carnitine CoA-transferase CaiB-like acyl-CoA transferase